MVDVIESVLGTDYLVDGEQLLGILLKLSMTACSQPQDRGPACWKHWLLGYHLDLSATSFSGDPLASYHIRNL